jgi:DNA-binding response OmpR family regulator
MKKQQKTFEKLSSTISQVYTMAAIAPIHMLNTDNHERSIPVRHDIHMTYQTLHLDPRAYRAELNGKELNLSASEFAMLHLLVRNPGRAFHRADLLDTLWGETYDGSDRAVDNLILRLRKKLGPLGSAIETVWSIGYRLREEECSQQVS